MKKDIQIKVAEPCHEKWNQMTAEGNGRFCKACSKVVVDFTLMTDQQILEHISKAAGSTCGRFYGDQLGRTLEQPPAKKPGWFKYIWQMMLPLLFMQGKSSASNAKSKHGSTVSPIDTAKDTTIQPIILGKMAPVTDTNYKKNFTIEGTVLSEKNEPLVGASVWIKGTSTGAVTDSTGKFTIKVQNQYAVTLVGSYIGFNSQELTITNETAIDVVPASFSLAQAELSDVFMGAIVVIEKKPKKKRFFDFNKKKEEVCSKPPDLKVYPNPMVRNVSGTISIPKVEPGEYVISIYDVNGIVISQQKTFVKSTTLKEPILLQDKYQPGTYVVNVKGKKQTYSTQVLVQ